MGDVVAFRSKHQNKRIAEALIRIERMNYIAEIEQLEREEREDERREATNRLRLHR